MSGGRMTVALQFLVFLTQWTLMIVGFGLLATVVASSRLLPPGIENARYVDAAIKGLVALVMSVFWLLVWDRQVRFFFYRKRR
jgi:hypothetical protein